MEERKKFALRGSFSLSDLRPSSFQLFSSLFHYPRKRIGTTDERGWAPVVRDDGESSTVDSKGQTAPLNKK
jgi:hypothetical protein